MKIIGNRVVAAKLSGSVDFLELKSYSDGRQMDWGFTAYRRSELHKESAWNRGAGNLLIASLISKLVISLL